MNRKLLIAVLAAVIVFTFGKVGYHILNPPEPMLTRGEQATFEAVLSDERCNGLANDYEEAKVDGQISYEYAVPKMKLCEMAIIGHYQFEAALLKHMEHSLTRDGLINTDTE